MEEKWKPNDEDVRALEWTIIHLKSQLWLFNKSNAETVAYLEHLLEELKTIQKEK